MTTSKKMRGVAMVRNVIADEHRDMQARAYKRLRPYLVGALGRLRRVHPAFQTVVFNAEKAHCAIVFGDGTQPREAPKEFAGLKAACDELAKLSEIEWLTAGDLLWQVYQGTPQPANVIEQFRHVRDTSWQFWTRRTLRDARYYMRRDIYSRTVYGSHRAGYGKQITDEAGVTIDEWVEPVGPLILRVLRERGVPVSLDPLCDTMAALAGFSRHSYFIWDVLRACEDLRQRGEIRRINPKSSEGDARYVLTVRRVEVL